MATLQDRLNNAMQGGAKATAPASTNTQNLQQRLNNAMQGPASPAPKVADTGKEDTDGLIAGLVDDIKNWFNKTDLKQVSAMQQAAGGAAMASAFSKDPNVKAMAQKRQEEAQELYKDDVNWGYTAANIGAGAADKLQGFGNFLSQVGQTAQKNQMAQDAQNVQAIGQLLGNKNLVSGGKVMEQQSKQELVSPFRFADKIEDKIAETYGDVSTISKIYGDAAKGVGGMAPAIAATILTGGSAAASFLTSSSAAGNAIKEAKDAGVDDHNALAYGIAVGGIEYATEKLVDGLGGVFGKGLADKGVTAVVKSLVKNQTAQNAVNALIKTLGEGAEEWLAEYGSHYANRLLVGSDQRTREELKNDARYSAMIGAFVSGIIKAGNRVIAGKAPDAKQAADEAASEAQISRSDGVSSLPTTDASEDAEAVRDMPGLATGLAEAKQNKTSTFAAPGAVAGNAASPQMYVQDVWRGASDSTITQNPAESNIPNAQEKRGTGAAPLNFTMNEGEQVDTQSRSTVENKNLTPEQRAQVAPDTHERISEAESLHRAQTGLYTDSEGNIVGYQESIDELLDLDRAMSGVESDRLQLLLAEAGRRNDIENIKRISRKWQEDKSFVAQALQATQKWIGDSPTTNIARIIAIVDKYAQTHKAKKGHTIEVPDFLIDAYLNAETDAVRDSVVDDIQSYVAQQTRTTLLDAWTALRYTNMLGNFKTQGRNISGNVVNSLLYSAKNDVAALMELALPVDQRTKSAFVGREWMKAAKSDYANAKRAISRYGKYKGDSNETDFISGIDERRNILGTHNPIEYYRRATNYAMDKGDEIFSKAAYSRALAGYLKAKGVTPESLAAGTVDEGIMEAARDYAVKQAQEVTFRDSNAFSDWVSRIGRRADTPKAVKAVAEGIAPFRRTPANVMVRAVEFSPLGFLNTAIQTAKAKKSGANVSASDIIDALSKNVTGSALFALGMILADNGLLRATGDDEDEDVDALMNKQDYSIIIPGEGSYTMDWLTPASLIMFTGAELMEMISDEGFTFADVESAITSLADPLINMSMLSGINDTLDNIKYSDNNLIQMAATSALSYLTQGLTNTLAGQIERIAEPERMSTYVDSENAIPDWLERSFGKASAKTPGWDANQSEYLDEFGNTESNGGVGDRVFENLFSPGYFSTGNEGRAAYDFVQETYDALNYNAAPDAYAPKSIQNGDEVVKLSQQERDKYQKVRGQAAEDYLTAASTNQKYKSLSNDEKVEVLKDLKSQAAKEAKIDVLGDIGKTVKQSATEKAIAALGAGDMVTYYAYWNSMDVPVNYTSNPNWQKFQTILDMGFDDGATLALMEAVNEDTGKKFRAAYNEGVPLADIVAYYEANTSRKSDGTEKKSADKKRAIRETEFSSARNRAILNRIF